MREHSSTGAKPVAKPGNCAGGHPSRAGADRKQQQPRQGEIKQYSANKLKSVTQVPAFTSSTLLLLPPRQRRFPAQKAAWLLPERAGKRESEFAFLQPISIALYLPAAARNLARQIRQRSPSFPFPQPVRSGSPAFSGAGDGSATWQERAWPSPGALAGR